MLSGLLDDPDVQEALKNPKVAAAYEEVQANPMSFMKYLSDPVRLACVPWRCGSRRRPLLIARNRRTLRQSFKR
eukprot:SAG31_NODE_842_length_11586_cov_9.084966_4_plen_74_part_00